MEALALILNWHAMLSTSELHHIPTLEDPPLSRSARSLPRVVSSRTALVTTFDLHYPRPWHWIRRQLPRQQHTLTRQLFYHHMHFHILRLGKIKKLVNVVILFHDSWYLDILFVCRCVWMFFVLHKKWCI